MSSAKRASTKTTRGRKWRGAMNEAAARPAPSSAAIADAVVADAAVVEERELLVLAAGAESGEPLERSIVRGIQAEIALVARCMLAGDPRSPWAPTSAEVAPVMEAWSRRLEAALRLSER